MTKKQLKEWYSLIKNSNLSREEKQELIRLNYIIMEVAHKIHNDNMLKNY